jgi:hypothetical protein
LGPIVWATKSAGSRLMRPIELTSFNFETIIARHPQPHIRPTHVVKGERAVEQP